MASSHNKWDVVPNLKIPGYDHMRPLLLAPNQWDIPINEEKLRSVNNLAINSFKAQRSQFSDSMNRGNLFKNCFHKIENAYCNCEYMALTQCTKCMVIFCSPECSGNSSHKDKNPLTTKSEKTSNASSTSHINSVKTKDAATSPIPLIELISKTEMKFEVGTDIHDLLTTYSNNGNLAHSYDKPLPLSNEPIVENLSECASEIFCLANRGSEEKKENKNAGSVIKKLGEKTDSPLKLEEIQHETSKDKTASSSLHHKKDVEKVNLDSLLIRKRMFLVDNEPVLQVLHEETFNPNIKDTSFVVHPHLVKILLPKGIMTRLHALKFVSPTEFLVQNDFSKTLYESTSSRINSSGKTLMKEIHILKNTICLVLNRNNGQWYRGIVRGRFQNKIAVFCVDEGETLFVTPLEIAKVDVNLHGFLSTCAQFRLLFKPNENFIGLENFERNLLSLPLYFTSMYIEGTMDGNVNVGKIHYTRDDGRFVDLIEELVDHNIGSKIHPGEIYKKLKNKEWSCEMVPNQDLIHQRTLRFEKPYRLGKVVKVVSPKEFYIKIADDYDDDLRIRKSIESHFSFSRTFYDPEIDNVFCLVEISNRWVRGKVEKIEIDQSVEITLIDYGDRVSKKMEDLLSCPTDIVKIPPLIYKCHLGHIEPFEAWKEYIINQLIDIQRNYYPPEIMIKCCAIENDSHFVDIILTASSWSQTLIDNKMADFSEASTQLREVGILMFNPPNSVEPIIPFIKIEESIIPIQEKPVEVEIEKNHKDVKRRKFRVMKEETSEESKDQQQTIPESVISDQVSHEEKAQRPLESLDLPSKETPSEVPIKANEALIPKRKMRPINKGLDNGVLYNGRLMSEMIGKSFSMSHSYALHHFHVIPNSFMFKAIKIVEDLIIYDLKQHREPNTQTYKAKNIVIFARKSILAFGGNGVNVNVKGLRGEVRRTLDNGNLKMKLVDLGGICEVKPADAFPITTELAKIPPIGVEVKIQGLYDLYDEMFTMDIPALRKFLHERTITLSQFELGKNGFPLIDFTVKIGKDNMPLTQIGQHLTDPLSQELLPREGEWWCRKYQDIPMRVEIEVEILQTNIVSSGISVSFGNLQVDHFQHNLKILKKFIAKLTEEDKNPPYFFPMCNQSHLIKLDETFEDLDKLQVWHRAVRLNSEMNYLTDECKAVPISSVRMQYRELYPQLNKFPLMVFEGILRFSEEGKLDKTKPILKRGDKLKVSIHRPLKKGLPFELKSTEFDKMCLSTII